ncbi:zinc finger protein [Actinopolyspora mortivallis]|uniref:Zinc finger protein n=1 Tax=Actinopolyspora mortivallis TaxID=33906 RepID=A0A2T0GV17_ACTMO|nr:zinc finger protein [Actinopolyspora mortivallis]PRW62952.1 hypothetical protein CEP50_12840 [Actinopolyspora mortivallis]
MSHPIAWVPAERARHASTDPVSRRGCREYPEGQRVTTLCGQTVEACEGELAWLWWTCPDCDDRARELVGAPPRPDVGQRS